MDKRGMGGKPMNITKELNADDLLHCHINGVSFTTVFGDLRRYNEIPIVRHIESDTGFSGLLHYPGQYYLKNGESFICIS